MSGFLPSHRLFFISNDICVSRSVYSRPAVDALSAIAYFIHAKAILADYGTAQAKLFLGSENFSTDSLDENRELGLIFSDAA